MRWFHVFVLPRYITMLQKRVETLEKTTVLMPFFDTLTQEVADQQREFALYKNKVDVIEKQFTPQGTPNEIDKADDDFIDVDDNFRIPIVDGIKVAEEGQDINKATPLRIYNEAHPEVYTTTSTKAYGSVQKRQKTN